jgi:hypothetical protein
LANIHLDSALDEAINHRFAEGLAFVGYNGSLTELAAARVPTEEGVRGTQNVADDDRRVIGFSRKQFDNVLRITVGHDAASIPSRLRSGAVKAGLERPNSTVSTLPARASS